MTREGIVVVDDYFPSMGTGFRLAEFSWLLRREVASEVLTTVSPLPEKIAWYSAVQPLVWDRVHSFTRERLAMHELAYVLFLNNAYHHVDLFEELALPFVLTLYPGGGLYLGEATAEEKLNRVLTSPMLKHVITTQPIVTERVKLSVGEDVGVTEILGVVVDPEYLSPGPGHRENYYAADNGGTLNVCFVAHKYAPDGADKGFPEFLGTVSALHAAGVPVRAQVVGGFTVEDLPPEHATLPIEFLGTLPTVELRQFYATQDLILSPTRADVLAEGSFDGFPTGASVEAALSGVAIVATDERKQNRVFADSRDIIIVPPDSEVITKRILDVASRPGDLRRLAQAGLARVRAAYSVDQQLWRRRHVLESTLEAVRASGDA